MKLRNLILATMAAGALVCVAAVADTSSVDQPSNDTAAGQAVDQDTTTNTDQTEHGAVKNDEGRTISSDETTTTTTTKKSKHHRKGKKKAEESGEQAAPTGEQPKSQ